MAIETLRKEALAAVEKVERQTVTNLQDHLKENRWESVGGYLAGARLLEQARRVLEVDRGADLPQKEDQGGTMPPVNSPGGTGLAPDFPRRRQTEAAEKAIEKLLSAAAAEGDHYEIYRAYRAWDLTLAAGDELPEIIELELRNEAEKSVAG